MKPPLLLLRGTLSLAAGASSLEVHAKTYPTGADLVLPLEGYDPSLAEDAPGLLGDRGSITQGDVIGMLDAVLVDPQASPPNMIGYTTSPASYDWRGTVEMESFELAMFPGDRPATYRKVFILGGSGFSLAQPERYENFMTEDPRELAARFAAATAARLAEKTAREADQAVLEAMPLDALKGEVTRRETEGTGQQWKDAHDIYKRRTAAAAEAATRASIEALLEGITEGMMLVEPARAAYQDGWGTIPAIPAMIMEVRYIARPPHGYGSVTLLRDDGHEVKVPAARAAELRALRPDLTGVPEDGALRRKIQGRVGSLLKASRHEIDGKVYWAGEASLWSSEVVVVSGETGNAVRSAKIRDRAIAAHKSKKA